MGGGGVDAAVYEECGCKARCIAQSPFVVIKHPLSLYYTVSHFVLLTESEST